MSEICIECYTANPPRTVVATNKFYDDPVCKRHYDQLIKQSELNPDSVKKADVKDPSAVRLCSHPGCDRKLKATNKSGRCAAHFYIPSSERDGASEDPAPASEPEKETAVPQESEPDADDLPFKMTLYSEEEYCEKFQSARYASPKIMALLKRLDGFPFKKIAVIEVEGNDTPSRLKDRIERTFAKYCGDKPYTLEVGQETKLKHVRIAKLAKGA